MEYRVLIFLHIFSAIIFAGYYMMLTFKIIPGVMKSEDNNSLKTYEKSFGKVIMISLIIQILTGFRLAMLTLPMGLWFDFSNPISAAIGIKFILLGILLILLILKKAIFVKKEKMLGSISISYIIMFISLVFIWTGISIRFGGF